MSIIHNIRHNDVESNLVYPLDKGYNYICQIDKEWLKKQLRREFGRNIDDINNKYAVEINSRLYVNHDGQYWLIEKPNN